MIVESGELRVENANSKQIGSKDQLTVKQASKPACTIFCSCFYIEKREKRSWEKLIVNCQLSIVNLKALPVEVDSPIAQLVRALH